MDVRIRRIARQALIVVMLLIMMGGQALAGSVACYINSNTKIYQKASTSSRSLNVKKNLSVTMTAYKGNWAQVKRAGVTAYIPLKYITLKNRLEWYVKKNTSLYKSASTSKKVCNLAKGTKVYVAGRNGNYFYVQNKSGSVSGYVLISAISSTKPKTTGSSGSSSSAPKYSSGMSNSQKIDYILYVASTLKGKPYASSANPPKSFDCSRFVKYCYEQAKIDLKSTAKDQGYDSRCKKITGTGSLKKGDIVCFDTNSSDGDLSDHTGIYIGGGQFVHASSSAGKVIVSTLSSGYYKNTFSWGMRVFQ